MYTSKTSDRNDGEKTQYIYIHVISTFSSKEFEIIKNILFSFELRTHIYINIYIYETSSFVRRYFFLKLFFAIFFGEK